MIIAGTGHRPNKLGGYSKNAFDKLVKLAEDYLKSNLNVTKVISGMALGWDQALAQAAINCNIPFVAAIPCYNQDKLWPEKTKEYYNILCNLAHEKVIITKTEYTTDCMQRRNIWMVNNCDKVLTIYDGTHGGTANCLTYAKSNNKPIINLYSKL